MRDTLSTGNSVTPQPAGRTPLRGAPGRRGPASHSVGLRAFGTTKRSAREGGHVTAPRLRVALLTREYPPEVYGGAGVHVTYLARELAGLVGAARYVQIRLDGAHLASLAGASLGRAGGTQISTAGGWSSAWCLRRGGSSAAIMSCPATGPPRRLEWG